MKERHIYLHDNTGAKFGKCIHYFGGSFLKKSAIGNFVVVALAGRKKVKALITKNLYLALLTGLKAFYKRANGIYIKFEKTKGLLLTEQGKLVGNKIWGNVDLSINKFLCFKTLTNFRLFI